MRGIMNEWIRCEGQLPPEGMPVITAIYGSDIIVMRENETLEQAMRRNNRNVKRVSVGYYTEDGWCGADGFPEIIAPSYWARLPEIPVLCQDCIFCDDDFMCRKKGKIVDPEDEMCDLGIENKKGEQNK